MTPGREHGDERLRESGPSLGRVGEIRTLAGAVRSLTLSQMLGTVCELGLPDALSSDDGRHIADLARTLGCHQGALFRLVRALAACDVFATDQHGVVRHTPTSLQLRTDAAASQHWAARYWTLPAVWAAWGNLSHSVRTGEPAFPHANGRAFFQHLEETPHDRAVFQSLMQAGFAGRHEAVASALTLAQGETVVD